MKEKERPGNVWLDRLVRPSREVRVLKYKRLWSDDMLTF